MSVINGSSGPETLLGTTGDDTIRGLDGDDSLIGNGATVEDELDGGNGNDTLRAGGGDSYLIGGAGNDLIDGGSGFDQVSYQSSPNSVSVNLATGVAQDGFGNIDTLIGIEMVRGSAFGDNLIGDAFDNQFRGLAGNDTINGGDGWDRVRYDRDDQRGGPAAVSVNLTTGVAIDGWGNIDTLINIEAVRATAGNDTLIGSAGENRLQGEDGNDSISGMGGDDGLEGGYGNDSLYGGDGDDYLEPGAGTDFIDGGAGDRDKISYRDDSGAVTGINATFTGAASGTIVDGNGSTDTFVNVERIRGTNFNDTMTGTAGDQDFEGEGGNDIIITGAGNDYVNGGDGNDYIDSSGDVAGGWGDYVRPGLGQDTVIGSAALFADGDGLDISYSELSGIGGINIVVGANGSGTAVSGTAGMVNDTFTYTHYFDGSQDSDNIRGQDEALETYRFEGFTGFAGNDTINGGTGGFDRIDYRHEAREHSDSAQAVVVNFGTGVATDTYGDTDTLIDIENVTGTSFGDTFIGAANTEFRSYRGLGGADTITGAVYVENAVGVNIGWDQLDYSEDANDGGMAGIKADLAAGTVIDGFGFTDRVSNINGVRGTDVRDVIFGSDVQNNLKGFDGNDRLEGRGDKDWLHGDAGDDKLYGDSYRAAYDMEEARSVYRLYQATLNRAPDAAGQAGWTDQLAEGTRSLQQVAAGFVGSPEFLNVYGARTNSAFVELLYQNVLHRPADAGGLAGWTAQLNSGVTRAQVVIGFSESGEFRTATNAAATQFTLDRDPASWTDDVFRLYHATLGRNPDLAGGQGWINNLGNGTPFLTAVAGFVNSTEFQNTYGPLSDAGFVSLLYQNVLHRAPDAAGLAGWTAQLTGGASRAQVVQGFSQSGEFVASTKEALKVWVQAQGVEDELHGGSGQNELAGGKGADAFIFDQTDAGNNRVLDLEAWDYLSFQGFGYADGAAARSHMTQSGADVIFSDQGSMVTILSTQLAAIDVDNIWV